MLRDKYNKDGYMVFKGIVSKLQRKRILKDIKSILSPESYITSLAACSRLGSIYNLFDGVFIKEILKEFGLSNYLIHPPTVTVMTDERLPGLYYGTNAHQDWPSIQGSLDMIVVWIALTDAIEYPLEVIPGSHLKGLRDGVVKNSVLEIECDEKFTKIECKAGDVVFLSGFTIHRTGEGKGTRISVSQRFDNANEETFIKRGYPCSQKRIVDRELSWKPTLEQIQDIYT